MFYIMLLTSIFFSVLMEWRIGCGYSYIGKDGFPHIGHAEGSQDEDQNFDTEGKDDILMYDLESFSCNSHNGGYLKDIIIHQNNICGFIAASDPMLPIAIPISALESTGASLIPSPTKPSFSFSPSSPRSANLIYLIPRKEICVDFIDSKAFCYCFTDIFSVTGKHNCLFDTALF